MGAFLPKVNSERPAPQGPYRPPPPLNLQKLAPFAATPSAEPVTVILGYPLGLSPNARDTMTRLDDALRRINTNSHAHAPAANAGTGAARRPPAQGKIPSLPAVRHAQEALAANRRRQAPDWSTHPTDTRPPQTLVSAAQARGKLPSIDFRAADSAAAAVARAPRAGRAPGPLKSILKSAPAAPVSAPVARPGSSGAPGADCEPPHPPSRSVSGSFAGGPGLADTAKAAPSLPPQAEHSSGSLLSRSNSAVPALSDTGMVEQAGRRDSEAGPRDHDHDSGAGVREKVRLVKMNTAEKNMSMLQRERVEQREDNADGADFKGW